MDCVYKCDGDAAQAGAWQQFFDACNSLASLKYEQVAGSGCLVVARRQHDSLHPVITFANPVALGNARGARKLLELSSGDIALHVDARSIFGLVKVREYVPDSEDLFVVRVLDHHHWQLAHNGRTLMDVRSGQPRLPAPLFNAAKLSTDLLRIFPGASADDADRLVKLVESAATEKHGTLLVVLDDAVAEASRLASQATVIHPCMMTPELIKHVTPIDGAVLMSPDGMCHAIGVILDGLATPQGNPARGARYNSAIRFVRGHLTSCLAIVISEDGGVDLIPDLRPKVRRSQIEGAIAELEIVASESTVRRRRFNTLVTWFEEHSFYLLSEHCQAINSLIQRIDTRLAEQDPARIRIIRQDFVPNATFDIDLYYESESV
jgi:hypothetical protein